MRPAKGKRLSHMGFAALGLFWELGWLRIANRASTRSKTKRQRGYGGASDEAVRILFGIPAQVNWYPTDISFVLVAVAVGAVVVIVAAKGFKKVAHFAEICAPWMILMFIAGALAMLPILTDAASSVSSINNFDDFVAVADAYIWVDTGKRVVEGHWGGDSATASFHADPMGLELAASDLYWSARS